MSKRKRLIVSLYGETRDLGDLPSEIHTDARSYILGCARNAAKRGKQPRLSSDRLLALDTALKGDGSLFHGLDALNHAVRSWREGSRWSGADAASVDAYYNAWRASGYTERLAKPQAALAARCLQLVCVNDVFRPLLLDVGCGSGLSSSPLIEKGCAVVGMDVSREMLRTAKKAGIEVVQADMSACFPFRSGLFDGAVSVSAAHFLCETDGAGSSSGGGGTGSITGSDRCSGGGDSGTCNSITHVSGTCTSRRFDCATLSDGDGFSSSHTAQSSADGLDQSGREGAALSGGAGFGAGEDGNSSSERGGSRSSEHHLPERALVFFAELSRTLNAVHRESCAGIQFHPEDAARDSVLLAEAARRRGLTAALVLDQPHRTSARRWFLYCRKARQLDAGAGKSGGWRWRQLDAYAGESAIAPAGDGEYEGDVAMSGSGGGEAHVEADGEGEGEGKGGGDGDGDGDGVQFEDKAVPAVGAPPSCVLHAPLLGCCLIGLRQWTQAHLLPSPDLACEDDEFLLHEHVQAAHKMLRALRRIDSSQTSAGASFSAQCGSNSGVTASHEFFTINSGNDESVLLSDRAEIPTAGNDTIEPAAVTKTSAGNDTIDVRSSATSNPTVATTDSTVGATTVTTTVASTATTTPTSTATDAAISTLHAHSAVTNSCIPTTPDLQNAHAKFVIPHRVADAPQRHGKPNTIPVLDARETRCARRLWALFGEVPSLEQLRMYSDAVIDAMHET